VLWDLYQQAQIRQLQRRHSIGDDVDSFRHAVAKKRAEVLEERLDNLTVVCEALWALLHDKLGLSDEQLVATVTALLDERAAAEKAGSAAPERCPGCNAALNRELDHCQFCGYKVDRPPRSPFDVV
jgi:hypothetical protein